ncbi:PREDICTED: hyaluronan mediated motility receptor isoform X1 [Polistes dominula]|uniref:Dynein regulatory complex protein 10 n=1 Tax=Polistes dominula TaxID=743375 RepID=A0ABM1I927_POLDO|nr:PREDICTED: hyaluronan mediated motility receptor isoform X1 [Polistes dominula]XP_015176713.1 PREDICTED: hyaluronan mediated motility receptor isoform X1 [Polistes dominula]XP_015176714.1 PREDICTED: hyaluronan mediated motility receptor isoform X1 [Polistes dominula]
MDLQAQNEIAIQRMVQLFTEFTNKIEVMGYFTLKKLIDELNMFKILIEKEMRTTPMIERMNKIKIRSYENDLKIAEEDVELLRRSLEEETLNLKKFKEETIIDIAKEESIIRSIKEMTKKKVVEEIKKSEFERMAARKEYQNKIELLQAEICSFDEKIQLMNAENETREKELIAIRSQIQDKSIELLAQYDRVIGTKHQLLEKLKIKNNILQEEQNKLHKRFISQNELYQNLKEEQEKSIATAFLERVTKFKQDHAAKIIQRVWRSYRERQLLKRKKKTKRK